MRFALEKDGILGSYYSTSVKVRSVGNKHDSSATKSGAGQPAVWKGVKQMMTLLKETSWPTFTILLVGYLLYLY